MEILNNIEQINAQRLIAKIKASDALEENKQIVFNYYNEKIGEASRCGRTAMPITRCCSRDSANGIKKSNKSIKNFTNHSHYSFNDSHS